MDKHYSYLLIPPLPQLTYPSLLPFLPPHPAPDPSHPYHHHRLHLLLFLQELALPRIHSLRSFSMLPQPNEKTKQTKTSAITKGLFAPPGGKRVMV